MFYKDEDIKRVRYNDIVEERLSGDDYLTVLTEGVPRNGRDFYDYNHENCYFDSDSSNEEKRLCRCLTLYGTKGAKCGKCALKGKEYFARKVLNATVVDFEIPVSKKEDKVGKIDLLIDYEGVLYCAEFKPIWNDESLLRMVAEIITYMYVWETCNREAFDKKYHSHSREVKKAIFFMEGSEQYRQWTDEGYAYYAKDGLRKIIKEQEIAVLVLRQKEDGYVIEKLN